MLPYIGVLLLALLIIAFVPWISLGFLPPAVN
jgi:TRAP-type C4-dicarboxylate transport system permease large subunit